MSEEPRTGGFGPKIPFLGSKTGRFEFRCYEIVTFRLRILISEKSEFYNVGELNFDLNINIIPVVGWETN